MEDHYRKILACNEKALDWIRCYQRFPSHGSEDDKDVGGYFNPDTGYAEAGKWGSGVCLSILVSLYCCKDSKFFLEPEIMARALAFGSHMERNQHEDGTWDLRGSNFHDATAAAFTVEVLVPVYRLLQSLSSVDASCMELATLIFRLCDRAGKALLEGGFHTPNHRWAIVSALSLLHTLTKNFAYRSMAERYLSEGVDINSDGAYTEKSVGIYDAVVDEALLTAARELERPELAGFARRNLRMIPFFLQQNLTLFTANSHRQDRGTSVLPLPYYLLYLEQALATGDPYFAGFARVLGNTFLGELNKEGPKQDLLTPFLLHPELRAFEVESDISSNGDFEAPLFQSGIIRKREGKFILTLLENNESFLHLSNGSLDAYFRLYASFFSRGQFKSGPIEKTATGYRMSRTVRYGYIRPLPVCVGSVPSERAWEKLPQGDWADVRRFNTKGLYPDWDNIDHGDRATANVQELRFLLEIDFSRMDEFILRCHIDNTDRVPFRLECILQGGGILRHESCALRPLPGTTVHVRAGNWEYLSGLDGYSIQADEFFGTVNTFTGGPLPERMRGEADADTNGMTLCFEGETPFQGQLRIRHI